MVFFLNISKTEVQLRLFSELVTINRKSRVHMRCWVHMFQLKSVSKKLQLVPMLALRRESNIATRTLKENEENDT